MSRSTNQLIEYAKAHLKKAGEFVSQNNSSIASLHITAANAVLREDRVAYDAITGIEKFWGQETNDQALEIPDA